MSGRLRVVLVAVAALVTAGLAAAKPPGDWPPPQYQWWNDPKLVEELHLTQPQRDNLGQLFQKWNREESRADGDVAQVRRAFHEAVEAADWPRARAESGKWADAAARGVRAAAERKVEMLAVLSPEQWKLLKERWPQVLTQPWRLRRQWRPDAAQPAGKAAPAKAAPRKAVPEKKAAPAAETP